MRKFLVVGALATLCFSPVLAKGKQSRSHKKPIKTSTAKKKKTVAKKTAKKVQLTAEQRQAALASLKLLRKMASATEVGLSLNEYKSRLIDTKADIDEQLRSLPQNAVRKDLKAAIDAYVDAGTLWASSIEWDTRRSFSEINATLLKKYSIPPTLSHKTFDEMDGELTAGDKMFTLNMVWLAASIHMASAEKMVG